MAALTVTQTGNLSAPATFGGATFANGDTITCGAFTLTIDVAASIGTSPNDVVTRSLDLTSAASVVIVAAGITLTMAGNIGEVNGSTFQQEAGSTVTFDNSASGGAPVYTFINTGFSKFVFNGTSSSRCTIQAIAGQTFGMGVAHGLWTQSYTTIRRCSNLTSTSFNGNVVITDAPANASFDTCATIDWTTTGGTTNLTVDGASFSAGTHATQDVKIAMATYTSGTRRISGCVFRKRVNYTNSKAFTIRHNYFGAGLENVAGATIANANACRENIIIQDGTINGGNGALFPYSIERNYLVVENAIGNPHFIAPTALLAADNTVSQNVFDSQAPDLVDYGDAILVNAGATSAGNKVISRNNLVIPSKAGVGSGTLLTIYANNTAAGLFETYRSTVNVNNPSVGTYARRAALACAEAGDGAADQVAAAKSNLVWGSTAGQGYIGERLQGAVQGHITPAGANYNWTHNTTAGDNGRGYEDQVAAGNLWLAGNATAAGVDANQGTGDPSFFDSSRNALTWAVSRGYGSTFAAAKTALQADPTRMADLMRFMFEGYRTQSAATRNAAHDGGCVGAANYAKTRRLDKLSSLRSQLSVYGTT